MSGSSMDWRRSLFARQMSEMPDTAKISDADAFEILCAQAICMEPFPNEIKVIGKANGWYNRIQMLAQNMGWEVTIKVGDKK